MRKELSFINKCKSWKECNKHIAKLTTGRKKKLGGSIFECVVKLYLQTEPKYQTKFKKVWLLEEVPYKIYKYLNLPSIDEGIDLIVKTNENEYWSIQAKYRSNINETLVFGGEGGLSTFHSLSFVTCKNIKHGLVCATVNKPPAKKHLLKKIGYEVADTWIGLDDNDNAAWKRIKLKAQGKIPKVKPANPLKHQRTAILKAKEHFINKRNSRGKLILPCGTGKTLTAYWIAQEFKAKKLIIAVPSIALVKQTLNVWANETILNKGKIEWLCVCSDETVDSDQDEIVSSTSDLGIKTTTNQKEIEKFIKRKTNNLKIIFTTYQSGQVTAKAARKTKAIFDLGLFDEAHKTVGHKDKKMAHLLHEKNIKIKKRLFMTATERIFKKNINKLYNNDYFAMNNPLVYGKLFYQLSFKKAIEAKPPIISDYKIITFDVNKDDIEKLIKSDEFIRVRKEIDNITARELAIGIALRKALRDKKIKNSLTFHSSIKRAYNFAKQQELISKIFPKFGKIDTFHVHGKMSASQRTSHLKDFTNSRKSLMTNARCLTEGIDLPSIDCVCFTDPKRSKVDIVQASGRALRLSKKKKFGYIMIPIIIPKNKSLKDVAKETGFKEVVNTVGALSMQDERIKDELSLLSANKKPKRGSPISEILKENLIKGIDKKQFELAIKLQIWDKIAAYNFLSFEKAREYVHKLSLKNAIEWKKFAKTNAKPKNLPATPYKVYKYNGWVSMSDWLGTYSYPRKWRNFKEARKFARSLKLKNYEEWREFAASKKRPMDIPSLPNRIYKDKGWISMGDWIGTGFIANFKRDWLPFTSARRLMHSKKFKSRNDMRKYYKKNKYPADMPINPDMSYKNNGWTSWGDYLGTDNIQSQKREWASFKKAKKFARTNNISSQNNWQKFCKSKKFPSNIPKAPWLVYKEWISWGDFLGKTK